MVQEIKQNGKAVFRSTEKSCFIPVVFNNLCGRNFSGKEYRDYILGVAYQAFVPGEITRVLDGKVIDRGVIPDFQK